MMALIPSLILSGCLPVSDSKEPSLPLTGSAAETTDETVSVYDGPEDGHMQLIPDVSFTQGMDLITQKDHANGDAFSVFAVRDFRASGQSAPAERLSPLWRLCQWDSGPDLSGMLADSAPTEITDGAFRSFRYDPETGVMGFFLDTSLYYGGRPAKEGDFWPHLLIEAPSFDVGDLSEDRAVYYRCDAESMILSFDIRLTEFEAFPVDGDWVDAAQFLMYFYVKGIGTNDFCWFGVQLFDSRWPRNEHYIGYDGGKADASGVMIYSIGSKYVYSGTALWKDGAPSPDGVWRHVEIDLVPYLKNMLKRGKSEHYFRAEDLRDLHIDGMNLGWETIGTFRHAMEIRDLQLIAGRGE